MIKQQNFLHFLGCGSAFTPDLGNTSAYFLYKDVFYLIDCGETVFEKIFNCKEMRESARIVVLLTHLHADHCGSLGSLLSFAALILHKPVDVVYPSDRVKDLLSCMGIASNFYTHLKSLPSHTGIKLIPHCVNHADDMDCFGYEVHFDGKHFYYSGDAYNIPDLVLEKFFAGTIHILFQDTNTEDTGHHCPLSLLERLIPLQYRNTVYCMHLNTRNKSVYTDKGFNTVQTT